MPFRLFRNHFSLLEQRLPDFERTHPMSNRLIATLLILAGATAPALAGTFTLKSMEYSTDHFVPHIHYEGVVYAGDVDALRGMYDELVDCRDACGSPWGRSTAVITMDSIGGSYAGGLALARFFREKHIATRVEAGMECYSACAFAFLGGSGYSTQDGIGPYNDRILEPGGVLGFHAPYFMDEALEAKIAEEGAPQVMGESREDLAKMVRELVDWNVDPNIISTMVSMGPGEFYYVDTPADLFLNRVQLPEAPREVWQPDVATGIYNVCLRLLAQHENRILEEVAGRIDTTFVPNIGMEVMESSTLGVRTEHQLHGFAISDSPLAINFCAARGDDYETTQDLEVALFSRGLAEASARISYFAREKGWSTAGTGGNPARRILQKNGMYHYLLDPDVRLAELENKPVNIFSRFFTLNPPAKPTFTADLVEARSEGGVTLYGLGDLLMWVRVGSASLFDTARGELKGDGYLITNQSESDSAFIREGTYVDTGNPFSFVAFKNGNGATLVRMELAKQPGDAPTDGEFDLMNRIACSLTFGTQKLNCGG